MKLLTLLALVGCNQSSVPKGGDTDSVVIIEDTGTGELTCETLVLETSPWDGQSGIYYRDSLSATFSEDGSSASFSLIDDAGLEVELTPVWDDGNFQVTLSTTTPMLGDTSYTFSVSICQDELVSRFTTSLYGDEMQESAASLVGNTYNFDMAGADYTKPAGLGPIIQNYLSEPLLLTVAAASDDTLDIFAAQ